MKTKIIYISGNELFDMADIRSAFDEVRAALALGPDTVLFGVPVDNDDALAATESTSKDVTEPIVDTTPNVEIEDAPVKKKPTSRRTQTSAKVVPISNAVSPEPVAEPVTEPVVEPVAEPVDETAPVVPILSVLGSKTDEPDTNNDVVEQDEVMTETPKIVDDDMVEPEPVTISDMIADEAPEDTPEKTLEELLESMTPLGEDAEKTETPTPVIENTNDDESKTESGNDIDITLEKLATEFVANQDKIETPAKPATRGKIGKLKNILPFKKTKHDDSGLMGDLFGWAGVAANDEEFTIPGFFK